MRLLPAVGLVLASACAPADEGPTFGTAAPAHDPLQWLEPSFSELPEQCFTDEFYLWLRFAQHPDGYEAPPTWAEPCVQALAADVGLVRESCDWGVHWEEEEEGYIYGCGSALSGTFLLATQDFGLVADLETGPSASHETFVQARFIEQLRQAAEVLGHDLVGPTLYDMVTSTITSVTYVDLPEDEQPGDAAIDFQTRAMTLYDDAIRGERMMALYMHEVAHPWLPTHHVGCTKECSSVFMPDPVPPDPVPIGTPVCDDDWSGAFGFQASTAMLAYEYGQDTPNFSTSDLGNLLWALPAYVNSEPCPESE